MKIAEKVKEFFHNEGIHSTTIQPEFIEIGDVSQFYVIQLVLETVIIWTRLGWTSGRFERQV